MVYIETGFSVVGPIWIGKTGGRHYHVVKGRTQGSGACSTVDAEGSNRTALFERFANGQGNGYAGKACYGKGDSP